MNDHLLNVLSFTRVEILFLLNFERKHCMRLHRCCFSLMGVSVKAKRQIQNFHNTFFEGGKTLHSLIDGATLGEIPSVYLTG